jgi:hypothetical protein
MTSLGDVAASAKGMSDLVVRKISEALGWRFMWVSKGKNGVCTKS